MKYLIVLFLLWGFSYGRDFKVASYNVENLFDLNYDKTEYDEFKPNSKAGWNSRIHEIKLANTARVLNDLNADIIGLVEIESKKALEELLNKSKLYRYGFFLKNNNSAIGVAIASKFPVVKTFGIKVSGDSKHDRHILEADIKIDDKILKVFVNHWKSKKSPESDRIAYAKALQNRINELGSDVDYVILGDLNSNYNEFETFKNDKRLNDTNALTGINHILNTTYDNNIVTLNTLLKNEELKYNLWLELPQNERLSEQYRGGANTPDNMIIPKALFDNKNISYRQKSFKVFKKEYLFKNGKIVRWEMKEKQHQGFGYSDHLPIFAIFSTDSIYKESLTTTPKKISNISNIYYQDELDINSTLNDVVVLFKHDKTTIIKQVIDRAILVYGENSLEVGKVYDIKIKDIGTYYGLSEIKKFDILVDKGAFKDPKRLYVDANKIDIFNPKYQNEILYNLLGFYNKGYLNFKDKKIKLYAKNKAILPKNNMIVRLNFGHLAIRNTKPQIIIYSKSDYSYVA